MTTTGFGRIKLGAVVTTCLLVAGCGNNADDPSETAARTAADRNYYSAVELPASKPSGLTYVKVDQYKEPDIAGQYVQLIFNDRTVYVCSPGATRQSTAPGCPMPDKSSFRKVGPKNAETVYAVGDVQGKTASAEGDVIKDLRRAELTTSPEWFVNMLETQGNS